MVILVGFFRQIRLLRLLEDSTSECSQYSHQGNPVWTYFQISVLDPCSSVSTTRGSIHDTRERLLRQLLRGGRPSGEPGLDWGRRRAALRDPPAALGGARAVRRAHCHRRGGHRGQPPGHPLGAREPQAPERR